ncbi:hypothetical protein NECAME_15066 [Necator americanus]|uniref:DUF5641 domain-containing protein n=1 Tax=Necator americanus TaxID=51031 RepID=W2SJQ8_NECAM|nr:hypothetical protein NECAME_15066 [Necator americanus]ETN69830.1 hypothetical protein NECAME_15066 [Necator americanus]
MLKSNAELLEDYDDTFKTQLDNGIIEEIPEEQEEGDNGSNLLRDLITTWLAPTYHINLGDPQVVLPDAGNVHAVIAREEYELVTSILDWDRFSSFNKAKQVTVRVLIFVRKLVDKLPTERKNTALEWVPELKHIPYSLDNIGGNAVSASRRALIRNHQSIHLQQDYRKSMENTLRLFKDSEGIWRSKGRVGNSALDNDAKNPAFITPKTALADLIIKEAHGTFHRGVEHTIATVRLQYWIPKLRQQDDPDYLPPERTRALATKREAEQALQSSCQYTEHFWNVWQQNYLISLREMHRKYISSQRHHHLIPKVGAVVLLCDPLLPRNEWKLARITQTNTGRDGQIREVELVTRKIKRPINLIVPLELDDDTATFDNGDPTAAVQEDVAYAGSRHYNLRPRQPVSYTNNVGTANSTKKACVPSRK